MITHDLSVSLPKHLKYMEEWALDEHPPLTTVQQLDIIS